MRPHFLAAALVVAAACGGGTTVSTPRPASRTGGAGALAADAVVGAAPIVPAEWGLAGRAKATTGARAMVVSGHPLASEVGIEIVKQGGNAVDAAVAVGFALEVVLPEAGNIGGGGFIVYRDTTGRVRALDYRETAPAGASRDMYLDSAGHVSERSLTGHLASGVPGSVAGMYVFYRAQIADSIVAEMRRGHGLITKSGLAGYRAKWRTPIQVTYRGYTIYSMPPASSGGVTMGEILNILEGYDTLPPFGSAGYVHLETEAMRRAFMDRNHWLGDPDFVSMPLDRLLSKSYAAQLRAEIDPRKATPTPPFAAGGDERQETTHYSVVDADGNAASVTTTLNGGFGSAVTVQGAG